MIDPDSAVLTEVWNCYFSGNMASIWSGGRNWDDQGTVLLLYWQDGAGRGRTEGRCAFGVWCHRFHSSIWRGAWGYDVWGTMLPLFPR